MSRAEVAASDAGTKAEQRSHRALEMLAVILLGVAAVTTAWCGFQAARWNGEEMRQARRATDARLESSRQFALATQKVAYDATIAAQYATAAVNKQEELKAFYRESLVREGFLPILDRWEAEAAAGGSGFTNLFDDKEYLDEQLAPSRASDARAGTAERASEDAGENADAYLLTTVLLATALFFAGVTTSFHGSVSRVVLLTGAALLIAFGAARLAGLPVI